MPPFGDGFKADGDMLPVPVCHGGFAVNGIVALGIICPPVRTPAFFSGEGTFQHGTAQKRKAALIPPSAITDCARSEAREDTSFTVQPFFTAVKAAESPASPPDVKIGTKKFSKKAKK